MPLCMLAVAASFLSPQIPIQRLEGSNARRAISDVADLCADGILGAKEPFERKALSGALRTDLQQKLVRQSALLVAEDEDGGVVGCITIEVSTITEKCLDETRLGRAGAVEAGAAERPLISSLAVSPRYRKRGLGKKLCAAAEAIASSEWGFDEVLLKVEQDNRKARSLYRKTGYRVVDVDKQAERPVAGTRGGVTFVPTVQIAMRKSLRGPPLDTIAIRLALAAALYVVFTQYQQPILEACGLLASGQMTEAGRILASLLPALDALAR